MFGLFAWVWLVLGFLLLDLAILICVCVWCFRRLDLLYVVLDLPFCVRLVVLRCTFCLRD